MLKQQRYIGAKVIPSALADTPCAELGVNGVLDRLNTLLGTSYALCSVLGVLNYYDRRNYDFGTAYAYLRPYWKDIRTIERKLHIGRVRDRKSRRGVLVDGRITTRGVPPRRVWDLFANRVVPYWVIPGSDWVGGVVAEMPWGISHAWVDEKEHMDVMMPINGHEWPVPIPKDANLDLIRIEMLNARSKYTPPMGEYAWLDVLCLRQKGGHREHLRLEEWKLDVPTIGAVYAKCSFVVCYFNGLGRPLCLTPDYFKSDRCWFRRAWTLQEITDDMMIGGETKDNGMDEEVQSCFKEQLKSLQELRGWALTPDRLVSEMRHRVSTNPLDKVAGLVYLLKTKSIPMYNPRQSPEDAWEVLMDMMDPRFQGQLFFFYPEPGEGRKCWQPSWEQVMRNNTMSPRLYQARPNVRGIYWDADSQPDSVYFGPSYILSGNVLGLSEAPEELKHRQGELVLKDAKGSPHKLKIVADHTYPIPDGLYALTGLAGFLSKTSDLWVVGQLREDGKFKKLSVFRSADDEEVKAEQLGLEFTTIYVC